MARSYTQLSAGDRIGKCEIIRQLGKGGMGAVYLAKHTTLDILVAVKTLADEAVSEDHREANRFIREAKLAAQIRHPNVVAIMDADQDEESGIYYIVMEYVDGGSLAEFLHGEALDPEWVFSVIYQTGQALQEASRFGVVHRDIKPHNIMVNDQGVAKLADLGLAKSLTHESVSLTVMGSALGTPAYMSPQQAADAKTADVRDDIYSLGATLYECLTGQPPFDGDSVYSVITKVVTRTPFNPRTYLPTASPALVAVCGRMMAKERENRYPTADALMEDLELIRLHGLDEVDSLSAAGYLDWGVMTPPSDPNAPTELMSPEQIREAAERAQAAGQSLTQQAILPRAREAGGAVAVRPETPPEVLTAHTVPENGGRKPPLALIGGAVVLLLLLAGGAFWYFSESPQATPAAAAQADAAAKPAPETPPEPVARTGNVLITTDPPGSKISVEGNPPQPSPALFEDLPEGEHEVNITNDGYAPVTVNINVNAGETARPEPFKLKRMVGSLLIRTKPGGVTVTLPDGQSKTSPASFNNVPVGKLELKLEKSGYKPVSLEADVRQGTVTEPKTVELTAIEGGLFFSTEPKGATITVAGYPPFKSNNSIEGVTVGKHEVTVGMEGYHTQKLEVEVQAAKVVSVPNVVLQPVLAVLNIQPNLAGSEYQLFNVQEKSALKAGKAPVELKDLKPGDYRLVLTHESDIDDPLKEEMTFSLKGGETKTVKPKIKYGSVKITATPMRTMVFYNGRELNFAPVLLDRVPVGSITFSLDHPRYKREMVTGTVEAGKQLDLSAELEEGGGSGEGRGRGMGPGGRGPGMGPGGRDGPPGGRDGPPGGE